jgi:hypothetical protein
MTSSWLYMLASSLALWQSNTPFDDFERQKDCRSFRRKCAE